MIQKRDGRKEPFVQEKIVVSMVKTGAPAHIARATAQEIGRNALEGMTTQEVRTQALGILRAKNPAWEKNWLLFDTAVKKRTG